MNIVLLRDPLSPSNLYRLVTEFPHYQFVQAPNGSLHSLGKDQLNAIEIYYGHTLSSEELASMPLLRWIHCTSPQLNGLCLEDIYKKEHILLTKAIDEKVKNSGELGLAALLTFAKNLFAIQKNQGRENLEESIWSFSNRLLLQVPLCPVGTAVAHEAKKVGFRVWGAQEKASFQPSCEKVFNFSEIPKLLPKVDILSISGEVPNVIRKEELRLMGKDSILMILGSITLINQGVLEEFLDPMKFRGIFIHARIDPKSPLWNHPQILIVPQQEENVSEGSPAQFKLFLYNLWQFLHRNYGEMKNVIKEGREE